MGQDRTSRELVQEPSSGGWIQSRNVRRLLDRENRAIAFIQGDQEARRSGS